MEETNDREGTITNMTSRLTWPLWQPTEEALESIAAVIASHWNAAKVYRQRSFWPHAESWLRSLALTTSPGAVDSSGKPQDPRRY